MFYCYANPFQDEANTIFDPASEATIINSFSYIALCLDKRNQPFTGFFKDKQTYFTPGLTKEEALLAASARKYWLRSAQDKLILGFNFNICCYITDYDKAEFKALLKTFQLEFMPEIRAFLSKLKFKPVLLAQSKYAWLEGDDVTIAVFPDAFHTPSAQQVKLTPAEKAALAEKPLPYTATSQQMLQTKSAGQPTQASQLQGGDKALAPYRGYRKYLKELGIRSISYPKFTELCKAYTGAGIQDVKLTIAGTMAQHALSKNQQLVIYNFPPQYAHVIREIINYAKYLAYGLNESVKSATFEVSLGRKTTSNSLTLADCYIKVMCQTSFYENHLKAWATQHKLLAMPTDATKKEMVMVLPLADEDKLNRLSFELLNLAATIETDLLSQPVEESLQALHL